MYIPPSRRNPGTTNLLEKHDDKTIKTTDKIMYSTCICVIKTIKLSFTVDIINIRKHRETES